MFPSAQRLPGSLLIKGGKGATQAGYSQDVGEA
jgi:hypothetical protein